MILIVTNDTGKTAIILRHSNMAWDHHDSFQPTPERTHAFLASLSR